MPSPTRQLAAIMFTDMVGYTALMQQNEQMAIQKRDRSKKIFEESLAKHDGKLLQYYGDGTMSIFSSALNAVRSAIEMQTLFCSEPKIDVRIGIHTGDVMMDDNGVYGDSVNVASRIESLATPGSVFISEKLFDEVKNNEGVSTKSLGYFELKNVKQPMQVYAVTNPGIVVPARDDLRGKTKTILNGIAVLPFASLSTDADNEVFCDGITEELINVLAKIGDLQVTSRTSVFAFKGKNEDVREIAAKLNVQKILEGSVRKVGNRIRVTAQLINAADGYHLWSETYDRNLDDIFEVQDDISRKIANRFRENLSEEGHTRTMVVAPTDNLEAYKKYLEGIHMFNTQKFEFLFPGVEALKEAARLDPTFAAPYSYLSYIYTFMGLAGLLPLEEAIANCEKAAEEAMKRDPENAEALLSLAAVRLMNKFDWKGGKEALDKSMALNPNNPMTCIMLCNYYMLMLEPEKMLEYAEKAHRLDPLGGYTTGAIGEIYNGLGKHGEMIAMCDEVLRYNPENVYVAGMKVTAIGMSEGFDKVIPQIEQMRSMIGEFPQLLFTLGIAYASTGKREQAYGIIDALTKVEQQREGVNLSDSLAIVYAHLGENDKFFEKMEESIRNRSASLLFYYKSTFLPESINNDERMKKIRTSLGLPV